MMARRGNRFRCLQVLKKATERWPSPCLVVSFFFVICDDSPQKFLSLFLPPRSDSYAFVLSLSLLGKMWPFS